MSTLPMPTGALPPLNGHTVLQELFANRMIPGPGTNPALVYERYLKVWKNATELLEKDRATTLLSFVREYRECRAAIEPLLHETHKRLDRLNEALALSRESFTTQERLVCGLGASHPLENGFALDYTLGVPYLPGSSIKGCARKYSRSELDDRKIGCLFGPEQIDETASESAEPGDLVFFSAFPATCPELDVDAINCHQPAYYGSDPVELKPMTDESRVNSAISKKPLGPIEYENPIPVFFLTVKVGTTFVFRFGSRSGNAENSRLALGLVRNALKELGIGAKTALGYGVMG